MRFAGLPNIIHAKVVTTHLDRAEVSLFEEYFRENIDIFVLKNVIVITFIWKRRI